MAVLLNALGEIRGRLGNCVYSKRNGKIIISRRPVRKKKPTEEESARHKKFGTAAYISSIINQNPFLKSIWGGKGAFNKITKANFKDTDPCMPDNFPIIIPREGFVVNDYSVKISEKKIEVNAGPLRQTEINTKVEKWIIAAGVIVYQEPLGMSYRELEAIEVRTNPKAININEPICFSIELHGTNAAAPMLYKKARVMMTLVTLKGNGTMVRHSMQLKGEN